jgi:hypothetical protein
MLRGCSHRRPTQKGSLNDLHTASFLPSFRTKPTHNTTMASTTSASLRASTRVVEKDFRYKPPVAAPPKKHKKKVGRPAKAAAAAPKKVGRPKKVGPPKKLASLIVSYDGPPQKVLPGGWPKGWIEKVFRRRYGIGKDSYFYPPDGSERLRSLKEVTSFLESPVKKKAPPKKAAAAPPKKVGRPPKTTAAPKKVGRPAKGIPKKVERPAKAPTTLYTGPPKQALPGGAAWPEGWIEKVFQRSKGKTKGGQDSYFYPPEGKKLRSIKEVARFLKLPPVAATPPKAASQAEAAPAGMETVAAKVTSPAAGMETVAAKVTSPAAGIETVAAKVTSPAAGIETVAAKVTSPAAGMETVAAKVTSPAAESTSPFVPVGAVVV